MLVVFEVYNFLRLALTGLFLFLSSLERVALFWLRIILLGSNRRHVSIYSLNFDESFIRTKLSSEYFKFLMLNLPSYIFDNFL